MPTTHYTWLSSGATLEWPPPPSLSISVAFCNNDALNRAIRLFPSFLFCFRQKWADVWTDIVYLFLFCFVCFWVWVIEGAGYVAPRGLDA
ncbi:hypothetical protein CC78DRAFT_326300 [Lojkania enalia]|uniref:Uncharacterized protein n=1 Tax=Lojkania enalia TaxID=147567 RepID=A0A9P4N205_9PLEO|nr:hypothetical protein CC78DRAFT_326300 [Didymosphaeria enalia]